MASMPSTVLRGIEQARLARAGPPPRTSIDADRRLVEDDRGGAGGEPGSSAWPTRTPATSVRRLLSRVPLFRAQMSGQGPALQINRHAAITSAREAGAVHRDLRNAARRLRRI